MKIKKKTQTSMEFIFLMAAALLGIIVGSMAMTNGMMAGLTNMDQAVNKITSKNF